MVKWVKIRFHGHSNTFLSKYFGPWDKYFGGLWPYTVKNNIKEDISIGPEIFFVTQGVKMVKVTPK